MDTLYRHRGLVYSDRSDSALTNSGQDPQILDTILTAIEWALANKPEEFPRIPGTDLYLAKTHAIPMKLYFRFTDSIVEIISIDFD